MMFAVQVHSEQWGQIVAEYDERQNRLAVEERTRICSQLNQFEQDRLLTQQENERAGYITEEEMLRMQLLQGRETDFIITQVPLSFGYLVHCRSFVEDTPLLFRAV